MMGSVTFDWLEASQVTSNTSQVSWIQCFFDETKHRGSGEDKGVKKTETARDVLTMPQAYTGLDVIKLDLIPLITPCRNERVPTFFPAENIKTFPIKVIRFSLIAIPLPSGQAKVGYLVFRLS
jgi:hypothetical protein